MENEQLLSRLQVEGLTNLSCSSLYRLMRAGLFPTPIKVGTRAVRWRQRELADWLESRPRATGEGTR